MQDVPVLIVGGGPVGLSASFMLSQLGVRSLLCERHASTARHPKSRGINPRTMEVLRQFGVEATVRAAGLPPERTGLIVWAHTLAGEEIERREPSRGSRAVRRLSPSMNCVCAQDDLEPVLRAHAEAQPLGDVRFNTEVSELEQDAHGVTAVLVDRQTNRRSTVRASFVIAADGAQSRIREQLGIPRLGRENVYDSVNILFKADLTAWTAQRPAALYFVENPRMRATFLTINGTDRWGLLVNNLKAYGYSPEQFSTAQCVEFVRLGVGVPDLEVEVLGIAPWTASALVADAYRRGRVFLAGDAAHEMPPTGGFGLNTGVQDVHNLTWKLALVLAGVAGDALLETYHAERHPVGRRVTEQSLANSLSMGRANPTAGTTVTARPEFLNEIGLIFGLPYASSAIVPDGSPAEELADPVTQYVPSGRPGVRAPHVELRHGGVTVSMLDLISGFTLMTGAGGHAWLAAAQSVSRELAVPITSIAVGAGDVSDPEQAWAATYGVGPEGAVLVRPDGYICWRSAAGGERPEQELRAVLSQVLCKSE